MYKKCKIFYPWMMICIALVLISIPASADEISVPGNYGQTIQAAIDNAPDGATITVSAGTYYGNLEITDISDLTIQANGEVIIDVMGADTGVMIDAIDITFTGFTITNISGSGSARGIDVSGEQIEIANNIVIIDSNIDYTTPCLFCIEPQAKPSDTVLDLYGSIEEIYLVINSVADTEGLRVSHGRQDYIEIFGIVSAGSAVNIYDNTIDITSTVARNIKENKIDTYVVGIAALEPLTDLVGPEIIPTKIDKNVVILNGEMEVEPPINGIGLGNDYPASLNLGIYAQGSEFEVTQNNINVTGTSLIREGFQHSKFIGESSSLGIWVRTPEGIIRGNIINASNFFEMGDQNIEGRGSAALSIGIAPQWSDNAEISGNTITVLSANKGELNLIDAGVLDESEGLIYGNGIGIAKVWHNNTIIDGNTIDAHGSVEFTMAVPGSIVDEPEILVVAGIGSSTGVGILVPYVYPNDINRMNIITRNTVAGTSSAFVDERTFYTASELGAGVLIVETGIQYTSISVIEPGPELGPFNIVNFNNLVGSSDYGLYVYPNKGPDVDAKYNWWGNCSGPYHYDTNLGGTGDAVIGTLDFVPWITQNPIPGHAFYGTVKDIAGEDVSVGVEITAYVDGEERGDILVEPAGKYGSEDTCGGLYLIATGDALDDDSRITFGYNGYYANEVALFLNGAVTQLNLTLSNDPLPEIEDPTPTPTPTEAPTGTGSNGGDGKDRIIIKAGGSSGNAEPGGEGIMALPAAATSEPTVAAEEAPVKGKSKSPWWWWLLLLLLAIGMITYYQWNKAE